MPDLELKTITEVEYDVDLDGTIDEVIEQLQEFKAKYTLGCYLEAGFSGYNLHYRREETQQEYNYRVVKEIVAEHKALAKKQRQYEKLKEELGYDT